MPLHTACADAAVLWCDVCCAAFLAIICVGPGKNITASTSRLNMAKQGSITHLCVEHRNGHTKIIASMDAWSVLEYGSTYMFVCSRR